MCREEAARAFFTGGLLFRKLFIEEVFLPVVTFALKISDKQ